MIAAVFPGDQRSPESLVRIHGCGRERRNKKFSFKHVGKYLERRMEGATENFSGRFRPLVEDAFVQEAHVVGVLGGVGEGGERMGGGGGVQGGGERGSRSRSDEVVEGEEEVDPGAVPVLLGSIYPNKAIPEGTKFGAVMEVCLVVIDEGVVLHLGRVRHVRTRKKNGEQNKTWERTYFW
jgi:hypothetical protein